MFFEAIGVDVLFQLRDYRHAVAAVDRQIEIAHQIILQRHRTPMDARDKAIEHTLTILTMALKT